ACLIGHLNPPTEQAEVYEELAELEKMLDEYSKYKIESPGNLGVIEEQIITKIELMHLEEDIIRGEETLEEYLLQVHTYIERLKHMQIRTGLHILGRIPDTEELQNYILVLTRVENGEIPSLPKLIAESLNLDYYEVEENSGKNFAGKNGATILDEIWEICAQLVEFIVVNREKEDLIAKTMNLSILRELKLSIEKQAKLKMVFEFIILTLIPSLVKTEQEIINTARALNGEFIEAGPGGAPTSGRADILPTGRNFYGVDPNNLPTPTAWVIGKTLAEQVVERYIAEEGRYPESIGIVLWSDSNIRSNGQCIAEILYLLGVRPLWQRGSMRVMGLEVIPLEELQRPRIDVMARISGLFRDSMAVAVDLLEEAVNMVRSLEENADQNYLKKHYEYDVEEFKQEGHSEQEATTMAAYRIFGCPAGGYGAGVASMIEEKNWENIDDLAETYVRWGGHIYGKNEVGEFRPEIFKKRLGSLDITIKNIDNHEVHLLNSDDFNAYCGGMNAVVKSIRGIMPKCYIGDSSDREKTETKSLAEEFRRVFRGESLNPKYLEGMKKHGYKGASDLAGLVAHAYGWDATSGIMTDWMYDSLAEKLVLNKEMQEWMKNVNPWALERITEKLLEAEQRGLWNANDNMKQALRKIYLEIEGELEERTSE
ncbi:MAG: cobaltochelatase subunit CobN, partial [Suipraeoptans sp.]